MATDSGPGRLRAGLRNKLGTDVADDLLDVLAPLQHGELARQADLLATRDDVIKVRGDIVDLKGQVASLDARLDKLDAKVDRLEAKVDKLEANLDTKIGKLVPKYLLGNFMMICVGTGMVFGAVKIA